MESQQRTAISPYDLALKVNFRGRIVPERGLGRKGVAKADQKRILRGSGIDAPCALALNTPSIDINAHASEFPLLEHGFQSRDRSLVWAAAIAPKLDGDRADY